MPEARSATPLELIATLKVKQEAGRSCLLTVDAASVVRADALDVAAIEGEAPSLAAEVPDHDVVGRFDRVLREEPRSR